MKYSIQDILRIINMVEVAQETLTHLPMEERHPYNFGDNAFDCVFKYLQNKYDLSEEQIEFEPSEENVRKQCSQALIGINLQVTFTVNFGTSDAMNKYKLKHPKLYRELKSSSWSTLFVNPDYIN